MFINVETASTENSELLKDVNDATAPLILKTLHDLSIDRRSKVVKGPYMNTRYRNIAPKDVSIIDLLLGCDLKAALATILNSAS